MRTYGEAVEVRESESSGAPAQFLWRGRLYVVREVLAHWIELGTWWAAAARAARPRPAAPLEVAAAPAARRSVALDVGAVEREVWRVEARAGRAASVGVYDLVHDVPALDLDLDLGPRGPAPRPGHPRWRLARALD